MLLSTVMLIGILPVIPITISADTASDTAQFISLPITIRDFAADGMLFEFNQVGATGTEVVSVGVEPTMSFTAGTSYGGTLNSQKPTTYDSYTRYIPSTGGGLYITFAVNGAYTRAQMDFAAIRFRTNSATTSEQPYIAHRGGTSNQPFETTWEFPDEQYNSGWQWAIVQLASGNPSDQVNYITIYTKLKGNSSGSIYFDISNVYFFSSKAKQTTFVENGYSLGTSLSYNQGDTSGFSLLATTEGKDYIHNLTASTIAGTTLIQNGTWGLTTDPDPIDATLNSGAKQQVYGAWIRTDLVEKNLGTNGKPVYTKAAVDYLADYMQQIFAVPYTTDGAINTYFPLGVKLFDSNYNYVGPNASGATYDLADYFRSNIGTDNLGTYADAKAKFEAGNLSVYNQVTTWYEAAYFLLHNTWLDSEVDANEAGSDGYGMQINNYKNINLVQATNSDGEVCYVFNSGYDNAVYDYTNGVIYNSQIVTMTAAPKNGTGTDPQYIRGNVLPQARFDPLGLSGAGADLGYGMSGDIYGDMITASTEAWNEYYDDTNYNLSLEGHAQFIYYQDDNLYFTFTGDDDVYLYINGVRVLDLGAAHSISKVKVSLNDVAELCGLQDGKAYSFDFFYMERHGTAANFGIETNIKIVDPAMTTTKEGFQNKVSTGYNGFVDPLVPVYYAFSLQNNGKAPITNLTFTDDALGVFLSKETITLNAETQANRQYLGAVVYNADGSVKSQTDNISDAELQTLLGGQLEIGEKIIVYGFCYTIPTEVWAAGNNTFPNTVYTTAEGVGNNAGQKLNGLADWKVQKREYSFQDYHVYEWVGKSVTLTKDELLQQLDDLVEGFVPANATIALSSASGATSGVNVNTKAVLNSDGSITYTGTETGADTFYYKVTEGSVTAVIGVAVYSYDVGDNNFVLDYGLSVELNGPGYGLTTNDTLSLTDNPHSTTYTLTPDIANATANYGDFNWSDPSLKYTLNQFIDNVDSLYIDVQVLEDGATELNKFTGIEMNETIRVAPASVMYYEDDFDAITYVGEWTNFASNAGTEQSADQDSNYGSDPNYSDDTNWGGVAGGNASNGTISKLILEPGTKNSEIMYFDFVGTGLELISRATKDYYSILSVEVYEWVDENTAPSKTGKYYTAGDFNGDGNNTETYIPVITESEGGDVYEVPVIKIDDLPYSKYRVAIYSANSNASTHREVYIDGVRIYNPLEDNLAKTYYSADEFGASFEEIRPLIVLDDSKITYLDITDGTITWGTGTTVVEDKDDDNVDSVFQSAANGTTDYLNLGPNNEIYLDAHVNSEGGNNVSMLAFYITKEEGFADSERTLQIGAHRKIDTNTVTANGSQVIENGAVYLTFGSSAADIADGILGENDETVNYIEIKYGTEQYITIDPSCLTFDTNGKALVLVGTFGGENAGSNILALTNLKIKGYTLTPCGDEIANGVNGITDTPMFATAFSLRSMMAASEEVEPEAPTVPEIPGIPGIPGFPELPKNPVLPDNKDEKDTQPEIFSAVTLYNMVASGNKAIITVEATGNTESLLILDENNNEIDFRVLSVRKYTDLIHFFTAVYSGRWDKLPEEKSVYIIEFYIDESETTEKTYSVYAVNDQEEISAEAKQVSIRVIATNNHGKNNKVRR